MNKTFYNVKFQENGKWSDAETCYDLTYSQMYKMTKRLKGKRLMKIQRCTIEAEQIVRTK